MFPLPAGNMEFQIHGFGIQEEYRLGMVRRTLGLPNEYLLVMFQTPVKFNQQDMQENSIVLIPPGTPHSFGLENESWIHSWLMFSCKNRKLPQEIRENFYPMLLPHLNYLAELNEQHILDGHLIDSIIHNILHTFTLQNKTCKHWNDRIAKTLPVLLQNGKTPSLEKLAKSAGLSVTRYSELFKEIYNISPIQYRLHALLTEARKLLLDSDMTIAEISDELGFFSPYYFSRQFRAKFGIPPRQIRKKEPFSPATEK